MEREYTYDEEVVLISGEETTNAVGDTVRSEQRYVSFAQIVSPYMRETYEAMAQGLKPEFMAVLPNWYDDYHGERFLEYAGDRYSIIRAYKAKDMSCELTVTKLKASVSESDTLATGISEEGNHGNPIPHEI